MENSEKITFAVIGDCHYSLKGNYSTRDCLGAKDQLERIIDILNNEKLDFVVSLGDLGDGHSKDEVLAVKETYKKCVHPVRFVIGNHDLVQRSDSEFAKVMGITEKPHEFCVGNCKFIVLNAFENSIYSRKGENRKAYDDYCERHFGRKLQRWPGIMNKDSWEWLENALNDAQKTKKDVIFFSHVPVWRDACLREPGFTEPLARIPEHMEMLDLMDKYTNIRGYIAGHYHNGGVAVRNGVLHKTVRSVCDYKNPTAAIFTLDGNGIKVKGIGDETDFTHEFDLKESTISGTAPKGCYVMTNCGAIQKVGSDGKFSLQVPVKGVYSVKAVKDKCQDVILPFVTAPKDNLKIEFTPDEKRKLYVGKTDGAAVLKITDDGKPVRWFDISGRNYGEYEPPTPMWTAHSKNYWADSMYAFTACGKVEIKIAPKHKILKQNGWYKGEPHNHLFHAESHYKGNVQQSAFIGKAEGYDWLCFSQDYGNDGSISDYYAICKKLSDKDNLYIINEEFPKSRSNHCVSLGVSIPRAELDYSEITSLQAADRYVWQRGGITFPVHPFEGHMSFRQLPLWLNCAPEKMPCIDFYYHPGYPKKFTENYWFMLLNRGYTIGCYSTSDGAFDVGRTPGSDRGSTYVNMPDLSESNIVNGIKNGRTMVSYDNAAIMFSVDSHISGDILNPDGSHRTLKVQALWESGKNGVLRIVRNGRDIKRVPLTFCESEIAEEFQMPIAESENCWYVAILETENGEFCSAASPIYFRNKDFCAPKVIKAPEKLPKEFFRFFEALEPDDLANPELIDQVAEMLNKYNED